MTLHKDHIRPLVMSGLLFCIDQLAKWYAVGHPTVRSVLRGNIFGWEYLGNTGIAFSLPFPNLILVIGTPVLLMLLLAYAGHRPDMSSRMFFGGSLIFFGALSNLIDRTLYALTIDYIRILTAVINIADIMIVWGTMLLLFGNARTPKTAHIDNTPDI